MPKSLKVILLTVFMTMSTITINFAQQTQTTIAFGSCASEKNPLPIFDTIVTHNPDMFIFLGDNIYGDTEDMDTLRAKYQLLENKPSYRNLVANTDILATWDDHDFGWNDAGRHYPYKEMSKQLFLDFISEPEDSDCRLHAGIYHSYTNKINGKTLQIIMLDGRTFRDNLTPYNNEMSENERYFYTLDYTPTKSKDSTLLGAEQWKWLEGEFMKPADIRIVCSGTQFGVEYNGYEAWANFPNEQQKMLQLIKKTKANGVIFLSGDVHYGEISKLVVKDLYPIYDITSSGLSSTWHFATPNMNRIEGPVMENHFGLLTINWELADPEIKMEIWDITNNQRVEYSILLSAISFAD